MPAIEIDNVVKVFGKTEVLHGVTLQVEPGEIIGLVGPSGCGKTTLINMIVGLTVPTSGTVRVLGEVAPYKHARKSMGFMPQNEALYEDITAYDNLRFFGSLYGMSAQQIKAASVKAIELARLQEQGKKLVSNFSGGMKRRLSLAIALLHSPKTLVLDEPTVGLDPVHRNKLWESFRELACGGSTVLITTHMMEEALRCDKIAMLREGSLIAFDSPDAIIESAQESSLEKAFIKLAAQEGKGVDNA